MSPNSITSHCFKPSLLHLGGCRRRGGGGGEWGEKEIQAHSPTHSPSHPYTRAHAHTRRQTNKPAETLLQGGSAQPLHGAACPRRSGAKEARRPIRERQQAGASPLTAPDERLPLGSSARLGPAKEDLRAVALPQAKPKLPGPEEGQLDFGLLCLFPVLSPPPFPAFGLECAVVWTGVLRIGGGGFKKKKKESEVSPPPPFLFPRSPFSASRPGAVGSSSKKDGNFLFPALSACGEWLESPVLFGVSISAAAASAASPSPAKRLAMIGESRAGAALRTGLWKAGGGNPELLPRAAG
ncbi:hypothetical protein E2320_011537 [Naja naja]|nr:hypothetical protein E2320_011537 [Naja naja]